MISAHNLASLVGRSVIDVEGKKVGSVGQVYVDPSNGRPNWVTVKTGLFGKAETFVPLHQADEVDGDLRVPFTKDAIKDAPRFDADGELGRREEEELYAFYGERDAQAQQNAASADEHTGDDTERNASERDEAQRDTSQHESRAGDADSAQTGTGTMRLRKYVVTEQATVTVPVTREEVRVEWVGEAEEASATEENTNPTDR